MTKLFNNNFVISAQAGIQTIKDSLFPIFCVECEAEGEMWCKNCRQRFDASGILFCPKCGLPSNSGKTHGACHSNDWCLDGLLAVASYRDSSPLARLVKQLKYHFVFDNDDWIKWVLDMWFAFNRERLGIIFEKIEVIPVPLHSRRLRERGFNQAEIIARAFITALKERKITLNLNSNLIRCRYTREQAMLSGENIRRKNLTGAFMWPASVVCPKNILLIDDVYTSGATMNAAASALKNVGAKTVWGLAFLRG